MKKTYQLTPKGKADLEKELAELKSRRGEIAQKIADARDLGDLSENAQYDTARDEQGQVESRISEIEEILLNSTIIQAATTNMVQIGCVVVIEAEGNKSQFSYSIVGPVEADPLEGRISNESPIGRALLGKSVGEKAVIKTPKGETTYTIIEIKSEK